MSQGVTRLAVSEGGGGCRGGGGVYGRVGLKLRRHQNRAVPKVGWDGVGRAGRGPGKETKSGSGAALGRVVE